MTVYLPSYMIYMTYIKYVLYMSLMCQHRKLTFMPTDMTTYMKVYASYVDYILYREVTPHKGCSSYNKKLVSYVTSFITITI